MTIAIVQARIALLRAAGRNAREAYNQAVTGSGLCQDSLRQIRLDLDLETAPLHPVERPSNWLAGS
jgi:hypothetical protein